MQRERKISFNIAMEGDAYKHVTANLPADSTSTDNIHFFVGDACNMPPTDQLGNFDAILCSNLLCRLPDPMALLGALPNYMNIGGVVLFVSPYSWLKEYTPKDRWIGGCTDENGNSIDSKQKMKEIMEGLGFVLIHDEAVPLIIRENSRKYQYIISDATAWRRAK
jgi:SAM-dependent methyltransferase